MTRRPLALACALVALVTSSGAVHGGAPTVARAAVYASVGAKEIVLGNEYVERRWSRDVLQTTLIRDKRRGGHTWTAPSADFALWTAKVDTLYALYPSTVIGVADVAVAPVARGGMRATWQLDHVLFTVRYDVEVYPGIAAFRSQITLTSTARLGLAGADLATLQPTRAVAPTLHAFRAGADWREPGYAGPELAVGDKHAGTWRDSRAAAAGEPLAGAGQWLGLTDGARSAYLVLERNDLPSSVAEYDGTVASVQVDYSRDVVSLGPIEEQAHAENPTPLPGRQRLLLPGTALALDPVFMGFGDHDGDGEWQFAKYLRDRRSPAYPKELVFNSNGTDDNVISTGAKDDMDIATVRRVAPVARALGVETFILDDGWQAISGDWYPDSPEHPEPRWDGTPQSKFRPRFPDSTFAAVRQAIAPMKLGLWMSPMHFHPQSATFRAHPEWACAPVGHATAVANALQPESSSNEAGIGEWGPAAIPHVEARIREAITSWRVTYFKFDFLAWLDCAGQGDMYDYSAAFAAMLDRLVADHPSVTFQIDETNDYRLFPFASVTRGPSWFQNGSPSPDRLLHNLWNLSPWVPAYSLGQHLLGGNATKEWPVATLAAVSFPSHMTLFSDLRQVSPAVVKAAAPWLAWHRRHRAAFRGVTYPLLADPLGLGWTALQTWDPERGLGALLTFRQDAATATVRVPLRNVPPGRRFDLVAAPGDRVVRTVTSAELTRGLDIRLPAKRTASVLLIRQR